MKIRGELATSFKVYKEFNLDEFIKGCSILCDYAGHKSKHISMNSSYNNEASIILTTIDQSKSIEINLRRDDNDFITQVLVTVNGENIDINYLKDGVILSKTSFGLDEIFIK